MSRPDFDPTGTVRVVGVPYVVERVGLGHPSLAAEGRKACCMHEDGRIIVADSMTPDNMAEVTLHELTHAIDHAMQAEMTEEQVGRMARGLYAVCRDNPAYTLRLLFPEAAARLDAVDADPHGLRQVPNPRGGYTLVSTRDGAVLGTVPEALPAVPVRSPDDE